MEDQLSFDGLCPTCEGTRKTFNRAGTEVPCPACSPPPPPPEPPSSAELPELPPGRGGLTAMEAAERLAVDWRRRETIRRRVQELETPYRLLRVVGRRPGTTRRDQQVYEITDLGREALSTWDAGRSWKVMHLVRGDDPSTAQDAARSIRPGVDFHSVLRLYARSPW